MARQRPVTDALPCTHDREPPHAADGHLRARDLLARLPRLDLRAGAAPRELVDRLAALREPRTTIGGVNLVVGLRPELWRDRSARAAPADLHGFDEPVVGPDGFTMPATQHDAVLWLAGAAYDVVFDMARLAIAWLDPVATVATETSSWPYRHDRDLTGFIDGTENPSLADAPDVALVPPGDAGCRRLGAAAAALGPRRRGLGGAARAGQEAAMGRTKDDSVELDPRPATSHVARTDQDDFGTCSVATCPTAR